MQQPTEKPLKVYLRERYGSSTQKLLRQHEKSLHQRARCSNRHIFKMRCRDEGVIPASVRIKPPMKTREGYRIAERASRGNTYTCPLCYMWYRVLILVPRVHLVYFSSLTQLVIYLSHVYTWYIFQVECLLAITMVTGFLSSLLRPTGSEGLELIHIKKF